MLVGVEATLEGDGVTVGGCTVGDPWIEPIVFVGKGVGVLVGVGVFVGVVVFTGVRVEVGLGVRVGVVDFVGVTALVGEGIKEIWAITSGLAFESSMVKDILHAGVRAIDCWGATLLNSRSCKAVTRASMPRPIEEVISSIKTKLRLMNVINS